MAECYSWPFNLSMIKKFLFLFFVFSKCTFADQVQLTSPLPLPVDVVLLSTTAATAIANAICQVISCTPTSSDILLESSGYFLEEDGVTKIALEH